jgi:hypothetical protein
MEGIYARIISHTTDTYELFYIPACEGGDSLIDFEGGEYLSRSCNLLFDYCLTRHVYLHGFKTKKWLSGSTRIQALPELRSERLPHSPPAAVLGSSTYLSTIAMSL